MNVNFRYVEEELRYLFANSDVVACVYQREYGPLVAAARDAQPRLQYFVRMEWNDSEADDSGLEPIAFEAAVAAGSPERDFAERSDDDLYLLYTGGTTGMPKGVMWRHEDVYFALGGGIDVFTNERVAGPSTASEKIDASQPKGLVSIILPPLMHGAGQFGVYRTLFEGNTAVMPALRAGRGVAHRREVRRERHAGHRRRDGASARRHTRTTQGRGRRVVARVVRQHGRDLLADREGSTPGAPARVSRDDRLHRLDGDGDERHPLRPKGRRTEGRHHECAGVRRFGRARRELRARRAGLRRGRSARARRQHPARLLQRSGEDRRDVHHRFPRRALVDPGRLRASKPTVASRCSDADRCRSTRAARRSIPRRSRAR